MSFERETGFLKDLRDELVGVFGDELGGSLFGIAAAEFFAGPAGVTAMFEKQSPPAGKPIPDGRRTMRR